MIIKFDETMRFVFFVQIFIVCWGLRWVQGFSSARLSFVKFKIFNKIFEMLSGILAGMDDDDIQDGKTEDDYFFTFFYQHDE